jgi:hypothetical protein
VCLLNQIDYLLTLDSCEGYDGWGYVYFRYGKWWELGRFVFDVLAPALREIEEMAFCVQSIDGDEPMAKLGFRTETIPQIVSVLKEVFSAHKFGCSRGRECKAPHN